MMPLTMASPGEDVRLVEIRGGMRMRQRLADLGLNLGMTVRVMGINGGGPLIGGGKKLRLGAGRGGGGKNLGETGRGLGVF